MGRLFLCVSAACVQHRRSGRYSPIDRTGLSDCQREFIFPTISLYLSLSPFPPPPLSLSHSHCARSLYRYPPLPYPPSIVAPFFPLFFSSVISLPRAHHNRSLPAYFPWSLSSSYLCFFTLFLFVSFFRCPWQFSRVLVNHITRVYTRAH